MTAVHFTSKSLYLYLTRTSSSTDNDEAVHINVHPAIRALLTVPKPPLPDLFIRTKHIPPKTCGQTSSLLTFVLCQITIQHYCIWTLTRCFTSLLYRKFNRKHLHNTLAQCAPLFSSSEEGCEERCEESHSQQLHSVTRWWQVRTVAPGWTMSPSLLLCFFCCSTEIRRVFSSKTLCSNLRTAKLWASEWCVQEWVEGFI